MNGNKNLVYDVGLHKGEDTDYYLKKGFKVVAFEANPDLVTFCKQRFANEINSGSLTIVEGAITDPQTKDSNSKIRFYKNSVSAWGTIVDEWADRNKTLGADCEIIEVPKIDFAKCLRDFGMPHYLKIDIEGVDIACLKYLLDFDTRPDYISIESNKISFEKLREEFNLFTALGYDYFQMVNQSRITSQKQLKDSKEGNPINYNFSRGASGLFGSDLEKENWKTLDESISRYRKIFWGYEKLGDNSSINRFRLGRLLTRLSSYVIGIPGWYDTHARHSSVTE